MDLRIDKGKIRGLFRLAGFKLALEKKLGRKVDLLITDSLDQGFLNREEILLYGNKLKGQILAGICVKNSEVKTRECTGMR